MSAPDNPDSYNCWRFAISAELPTGKVLLYSALSNETPAATLDATAGKIVEVLWLLCEDSIEYASVSLVVLLALGL
ncbi:hypothetical protein [Microcoleus sp. FACHB-831]|uniref:hypothetical protein n=1 Tax=Microcoleus sp. FACHB-831 TaxID=2692827 RepID=UPI001A7F1101|nr:hypothetical protein [Microcoleus sp. FACHB-831]